MTKEITLEEGFSLIKLENDTSEIVKFERAVDSTFIQLHFSIKNTSSLHFGPHYKIDVKEDNSLLLYNPNQNLPINLSLNPNSKTTYINNCYKYLPLFLFSSCKSHSFFR